MDLDVAFAAKPVKSNNFNVVDTLPVMQTSEHPIHCWIQLNPGAAKHEVADNHHDLSRFQVYNWLAAAVERGEVVCIESKYYAPTASQQT